MSLSCLLIVLGTLTAGTLAANAAVNDQGETLYSDKYDHIDAVSILGNDKLREQYYKCFAGLGNCATPDAKFFNEIFPEAVVTKCRRCTEKQKDNFNVLVEWYTENEPQKWEALVRKAVQDVVAKSQKRKNEKKN